MQTENVTDITDFLPKYPDIHQSEYDVLNPYDDDFYTAIFKKKEFYENKLEQTEAFPKERGMQTKYQKTISRYMSSHTQYDRLLLVHSMGLGKTCSAIGAIEQIKNENSNFTGALVLAKGSSILENFVKELVEKCTPGQYIPENYNKLSSLEKTHRIKKKIGYYQFRTFIKFKKIIKKMSDQDIIENYSNKIIVIDEVHNLREQDQESDSMDTYEQYYRFLHLVQNCKVLLLSGTPMKDSPDEIASVANLIIPEDQKLPVGEDFLNEYMYKERNAYILKPEKIPELKEKLKGKISFLREPYSNVDKKYLGKEKYGKLKHFVVYPTKMSDFQSKYYNEAFKKDSSGQKGVYINSREASLFVYPDGSYGKTGFTKYVRQTKKIGNDKGAAVYTAPELLRHLRGKNDAETLENISKYSATYAEVISNIINTKGNCFVYSSLAQGSGAIVFSLLLQLFGFYKATGNENSLGLRYAILTNKTASSVDIRKITEKFNSKENMHGEIIKVIIGSRAVSEGFSFKNVIFEAINTPHWNYSETAQALARGIRLGSHNDLIKNGENPVVNILQPVSIPKKKFDIISIDLFMYETSEDKDLSIRRIMRLLMEIAFDCALNYLRNFVDGKDGSRECDYVSCKYQCEGVEMKYIEEGVEEKDLDFSTYQLYYANTKIPLIRKKIEALFLRNNKIDLDSIINNLKAEFSEEEVRNALFIIQEETQGTQFDYRKFLELYSRSSVKKIMDKISSLFREYFQLSIFTIFDAFPEYTQFEVLTALKNIINDSMIIINKYGFVSYLREENNMYFLVNNLSVTSSFFSVHYTKFPYISAGMLYSEVKERLESNIIPELVNKLCDTQDEKEFNKLIKLLPEEIQEFLIEASLVAEDKNLKKGKTFRKNITKFFKGYIKNFDDTWVSTYLKDGTQVLRCLEVGKNMEQWKNCDEEFNKKLTKHEETLKTEKRNNNPYGIVGLFNPINGAFCIVDYKKEDEIKNEAVKKRTKSIEDKRIVHSGKVCGAGGWKLPELMTIAIKRLKLPAPPDFFKGFSREKMLSKIKSESKLSEIFTDSELKKANEDTLRRALYWGLTKREKGNRGIKPICEALKKWFESKGLLEVDDQCGVQGKKKIDKTTKSNKKSYRIAEFIASKDEEFKEYIKELAKIAGDFFGDKNYRIDMNNDTWIVIFLRKKIVGAVVLTSKKIKNIFIAKNYRRQGIPQDALSQTFEKYEQIEPNISLENNNKNIDKNIKMFIKFGFKITKSDDKYTYMQFSGEA